MQYITVTNLEGDVFYINTDLIEYVRKSDVPSGYNAKAKSIIGLASNERFGVLETVSQIMSEIEKVIVR